MVIVRNAAAGTLESSDVMVEIGPSKGLQIDIESTVLAQFGDALRRAVEEELARLEVTDAAVRLSDRGALDCTVKARVETAVRRAAREA